MYYRDCHGNMENQHMMHSNVCPMMQNGMCPMNQNYNNPMMENYNSPMHQDYKAPMMMETKMGMKMEDGCVSEKQLEMMYPESYYIIYPHVRHHCEMMEEKHGKGHCPCKEELEKMIDDICEKSEKELESCDDKKDDEKDDERRRRRYGRGRLLRDLAGVILINELIGRRNPYYGLGYGPGYGYWY